MNFTANHSKYDTAKHEGSYSIDDTFVSERGFQTIAKFYGSQGILVPEIISCNYPSRFAIVLGLMMTFSFSTLVIFLELGIIDIGFNPTDSFFLKYCPIIIMATIYFIFAILPIIYLSDYCYFIFKGDKVIFQSKWLGRRIYESKDLQFHLFRVGGWNMCYQLEIELPDLSIPEPQRQIIVESTASKKTMDGILSVLFPLLRGEMGPYYSAVKRKIEPIAPGGGHSWWWRYENLENHLGIWFLNHKVNQFLFWLVHGSQEKLMAKERSRDDIFSL